MLLVVLLHLNPWPFGRCSRGPSLRLEALGPGGEEQPRLRLELNPSKAQWLGLGSQRVLPALTVGFPPCGSGS